MRPNGDDLATLSISALGAANTISIPTTTAKQLTMSESAAKTVKVGGGSAAVSAAAGVIATKQKSQFASKLVCGAIAGVVGTCVIFFPSKQMRISMHDMLMIYLLRLHQDEWCYMLHPERLILVRWYYLILQ
jgi:antitoxin component of MazEF toxin-antitoxin module